MPVHGDVMTRNALADALAWQRSQFPRTGSSCGPVSPPWHPVSAFATAGIDDLLAYQSHFAAGMDQRTRGAHAIAFHGHHLALVSGAAFFMTGLIFQDPGVLFEAAGDTGVRRLHFRFSGQFATGSASDFGHGYIGNMTPVIAAVGRRTGLSAAASWRLAADAVAGAFLEIGTAMADEARAMAAATEIVHDARSRLYAPETGFCRIEDASGGARMFRLRGGCCLYYRTKGGTFCDTCVLLDADSRQRRLAAHVDRAAREV